MTTTVNRSTDGLATPPIIAKLEALQTISPVNFKLLPNVDNYWHLLKGKYFDFAVEDNDLRIEVNINKLTQAVASIGGACHGEKGAIGDAGINGRNGLPGPNETPANPTIGGKVMTANIPIPIVLDTPISARFYKDSTLKFEILVTLAGVISIIKLDASLNFQVAASLNNGIFNAIITAETAWGSGWSFKARQVGPDGVSGDDGSSFLTISSSVISDDTVMMNSAIRVLRKNSGDGLFYIVTQFTKDMPVSHLRPASGVNCNAFELAAIDVWAAVEPVVAAKRLLRWKPNNLAYDKPELTLVEWIPTKVCDGTVFVDFDWFKVCDTNGCESILPFEILTTKQPIPQCCQDDLFFCPNILDMPCTSGNHPIQTANTITINNNYTATNDDEVILVDASLGPITVTLPDVANKKVLSIKKIDSSSNAVTIDGAGANVDGASSYDLPYDGISIEVVSDSTQWWII